MPYDPRVGWIPEVSMGCSVPEDLGGHVIVNLATPDPLADVGSVGEVSPGTWYASGPPQFVGAMPLRTDLTILPADRDSQNTPVVVPYEEPFVIHETDMSQVRFEPVSEVQAGQILVATDTGNHWGPAPSHLYSDPDGGSVHLNQSDPIGGGDITFNMQGGLEVIRIAANGDFFVQGRKVDNDHEIYQNFRKFLGMSYSLPVPDPRPREGIETRYERVIKKCIGDQ